MCIWVCNLSIDSIDQSYTEPPGIFICGAIIFLIFIFYAPEVGKIILVYRPLIVTPIVTILANIVFNNSAAIGAPACQITKFYDYN